MDQNHDPVDVSLLICDLVTSAEFVVVVAVIGRNDVLVAVVEHFVVHHVPSKYHICDADND
jgi:hypothetical protein